MPNPLKTNKTGVARVPKFLVRGEVPTYPSYPLADGSVGTSGPARVFSYPGYPGFIGYQGVIPWFFLLLTLVSLVFKWLELNG
jgi:hypothetical protein